MRKRSRPGRQPDMAPLLRRPKYRPVLGCVQVVPPQELPDGSLLRGAPPGHCLRSGAYIAAIKKRDQNKISPIRVSTLSGEPRILSVIDTLQVSGGLGVVVRIAD